MGGPTGPFLPERRGGLGGRWRAGAGRCGGWGDWSLVVVWGEGVAVFGWAGGDAMREACGAGAFFAGAERRICPAGRCCGAGGRRGFAQKDRVARRLPAIGAGAVGRIGAGCVAVAVFRVQWLFGDKLFFNNNLLRISDVACEAAPLSVRAGLTLGRGGWPALEWGEPNGAASCCSVTTCNQEVMT